VEELEMDKTIKELKRERERDEALAKADAAFPAWAEAVATGLVNAVATLAKKAPN
jgi:hypothetical protein